MYNTKEINFFVRQIEKKEITETKEILMRKDKRGTSVAHSLAYHSRRTLWSTDNKEILMLQDKLGESVAHRLAWNHPTWTTDDIEILSLDSSFYKQTVEDALENKKNFKIKH